MRNAYKILLVGKTERRRSVVRLRIRWDEGIGMDIRELD
jgi:hypothetical protein